MLIVYGKYLDFRYLVYVNKNALFGQIETAQNRTRLPSTDNMIKYKYTVLLFCIFEALHIVQSPDAGEY